MPCVWPQVAILLRGRACFSVHSGIHFSHEQVHATRFGRLLAPGYEARTCSNRREILQASVQMWHFMAQKITGIRSALKGFLGQGWEGSMLSDPLNAA